MFSKHQKGTGDDGQDDAEAWKDWEVESEGWSSSSEGTWIDVDSQDEVSISDSGGDRQERPRKKRRQTSLLGDEDGKDEGREEAANNDKDVQAALELATSRVRLRLFLIWADL